MPPDHASARRPVVGRWARLLAALAVTAAVGAALSSVAGAARPRGNANYIASDRQGRPAITLWMRTQTNMFVFVCYDWGPGPDHGNHYNNVKPVHVGPNGRFSFVGRATNLRGRATTLKLRGKFVSADEVVGVITAPCMHRHRFTAHYSAH